MNRREAVVLPAALASWRAEGGGAAGPVKIHRVGMLCAGSSARTQKVVEAFVAEMSRLGFVEGKNLSLDRPAVPSLDAPALAAVAAALAARRVDVLTSWCGTPGAVASKEATRDIPVVFESSADPVALGLVSSLASPGGNVTGFSVRAFESGAKQLEYLVQAKSGINRVAIVHHASSGHLPWFDSYRAALEQAALRLGIAVQFASVPDVASLGYEFGGLVRDGAGAVFVLGGIQTPANFSERVASLALKYRLPSSGAGHWNPVYSHLIARADDPDASGRRMARYVARILGGTPPGDLPVEQIEPSGLIIDLRRARALGLTIPKSLLLRATEVIE